MTDIKLKSAGSTHSILSVSAISDVSPNSALISSLLSKNNIIQ